MSIVGLFSASSIYNKPRKVGDVNKYRLLITSRFIMPELQRLDSYVDSIRFAGWGTERRVLDEASLRKELSQIDIYILGFETLTARILGDFPALKLIGSCRTSPEANIDIDAATQMGIPVVFTPGRNAISVAEYTIGLMIDLARNISKTHHLLRYSEELTNVQYEDKTPERRSITSEWSMDADAPFNRFQGPELFGKTIGLIGCGAVGQEILKRTVAFGMKSLVYDPYATDSYLKELSAIRTDLNNLARESDFIVLAATVTNDTRGIFSAALFKLMKPSAFFINTARAALADYAALYTALAEKRIAGAALDVYPEEPIARNNPFRTLDNVVLSPHLAGASSDVPTHHSRMMVDDLILAFNGKRPKRLLNPKAWEQSPLSNRKV